MANDGKKGQKNKMFYFFVICMVSSLLIIGATFAYFMANAEDNNTVHGGTYTTSFNLSVSKVTDVDMAFGLIPMKNSEAPHAAEQMCYDDLHNAGCQIYKITLTTDSEDVFFVDGYVTTDTKEGVETRFTRVYPTKVTDKDTQEEKEVFSTKYFTKEDFSKSDFDEKKYIKTGLRQQKDDVDSDTDSIDFNRDDDYDCLLVSNEKVGGETGKEVNYYVMIWVYDNGMEQNELQGMELAYTGSVTFQTAQGNEIKATFS